MTYQFKFDRVMSIKENEKGQLTVQYSESVKQFEQVALELYNTLKKKENLTDVHNQKLLLGLSAQEIKQYQLFVDNLEKEINLHQLKVGQARQNMQLAEAKLREKNLEVKKYEKMRVKDFEDYVKRQNELESKQFDEISIRQYMHRGIR